MGVDKRRSKRKYEGEASESEVEKAILTIQSKRRKLNPEEMAAAEELKLKELAGMRLGHSSVELSDDKPWWTLTGKQKQELDLSLASKGPFYREKKSLMKLRVTASLRKNAEDPLTNFQRAMGKKPSLAWKRQCTINKPNLRSPLITKRRKRKAKRKRRRRKRK